MADKGFTIYQTLKEKGCSLNIPPFLTQKGQVTPEQIKKKLQV